MSATPFQIVELEDMAEISRQVVVLFFKRRDWKMIVERHYEGLTFQEIATRNGVSSAFVRQKCVGGIRRLAWLTGLAINNERQIWEWQNALFRWRWRFNFNEKRCPHCGSRL